MIRGLGAKIPAFKFNADDVTFNPYVAKRNTGVFAASPIVQGHWDGTGTSDTLRYPRGDQFGNPTAETYSNLDSSQGSIVFWITPEWDGNDGLTHAIYDSGSDDDIRIRKAANNTIRLIVGTQVVSTSTVGWLAGSTYLVVCSWDLKNTIDGTNYLRISINDAHTYGGNAPGIPTPGGTIYLGSTASSTSPTNALIEGFTIYRRPLFDDTYGVINPFDASGPIDEIAAIYAAGAGADPCLTTGSWDVVFALPTNASAGVLQTGTGHAWSHPHSSNVLNHWTLEDGYYGGAPWAVAFNGTSTNINCGSAAVLDDLPAGGNILTVDAWVRPSADALTIASKGVAGTNGWQFRYAGLANIYFYIELAGGVLSATAAMPQDGKWHHVTGYYNDTTKTARVAVDGVWGAAVVGGGAYQADAAENLVIGQRSDFATWRWNGAIGWVRLSNNDRHTAGTDFIPPREPPGTDVNRIEQWNLADGTGATATAEETSPGNDGTITAGTWEQQWDDVGTPPIPTSLEFDGAATVVDCGSAAAIDDIPSGATITVEAWVRTSASDVFILNKADVTIVSSGWSLYHFSGAGAWRLYVNCATTDARAISYVGGDDDEWHHVVGYYDDTTKVARVAFDGIWGATNTGAGAYQSDAANTLYFGRSQAVTGFLDGAMSWVRLSDNDRYGGATGTTFVPPDRVNPPGADGNTVEQWDLQDGAGLTALAVVTTPGNDGTITMGTGRWWNTPDMESESPGSRVYNWGEAIGSDAPDDGRHQHLAGLTPGSNHVARVPVRYEADGRAQPRIRVYDETNSATIVDFDGPWLTGQHDGGADQAALSDSSAPYWPYSLVTGTIWNITKGESATITAAGNSIVGTLSGGADWDDNDVYFIVPVAGWTWADTFAYELPTIARNGAAADCVEISFQRLNSAGEGLLYWQQVEVLENLIDGPSMEVGAGDPWIPAGWGQVGIVTPGDTQASSTGGGIIHSGSDCIQLNAGIALNDYLIPALVQVIDRFYTIGGWAYGDGGASAWFWITNTANQGWQASGGGAGLPTFATAAVWDHASGIFRAKITNPVMNRPALAFSDITGTAYADDMYAFELDDVSLTVTPASEANSLETSGLRVDGTDQCTQTQYNGKNLSTILGKSKWEIEFDITPRHDAADVTKFGTSSPDIAWFFGDANDYIFVDYSAASILRLAFDANGGGEQSGTWNPATMNAGTTYTIKIKGAANSKMELYVDGVLRITISQPCAWGTAPATASWGHHYAGGLSYDATFKKP